jgi:hypothetical protein
MKASPTSTGAGGLEAEGKTFGGERGSLSVVSLENILPLLQLFSQAQKRTLTVRRLMSAQGLFIITSSPDDGGNRVYDFDSAL